MTTLRNHTMSFRNAQAVCAVVLPLLIAGNAVGAQTPLVINSLSRTIWVNGDATPSPFEESFETVTDPGDYMNDFSIFVVGDEGANADSDAAQDSKTQDYGFSGSGIVSAGGFGTEDFNATSYANSQFTVNFTTPEVTPFYLRYRLQATSNGPDANPSAYINFFGRKFGGNFFLEIETVDSDNNYETIEGVVFGVLNAGQSHSIDIRASASGAGYQSNSYVASAEFEFEFTILDTDADGLLDLWEDEQGIDVDNDTNNVVDLPLDGADKMKKDIFVEYDIVDSVSIPDDGSSGTSLPAPLQMVKEAFLLAPAIPVDNPDNSIGINLHLIDGLDSPVGGMWADEWLKFAQAKNTYLGLPQERAIADADKRDAVKDARELTYRYGIFTERGPTNATGTGETPGNDFMVHLDTLSNYTNLSLKIDAVAGTFMHELGHTLGFRHGGGDGVNFKPNYMSVMNYSFQVPLNDPSRPRIWWLDYSREQFDSLDEEELVESDGMGATDPIYNNRVTYWNSAAWSDIVAPPPALESGPAGGIGIDWNNDGSAGTPGLLRQDLNHLVSDNPPPSGPLAIFASSPSFDMNPNAGDLLDGYCDWCSIHYRLFGASVNFNSGVYGPYGRPAGDVFEEPVEPDADALTALVLYQRSVECPADFTIDGVVSGADLAILLAAWGSAQANTDLNADGVVDGGDLAIFLAAWGGC